MAATFMRSVDQDPLSRFVASIDSETAWPCWAWKGSRDQRDYGTMSVGGKPVKAHRFSYATFIGPIPDRLVIDHICRHHWCVNPRHLEPVAQAENMRRGRQPGRRQQETCRLGHPMREANVGYRSNGQRQCLACGRLRERRRRAGAELGATGVQWGALVRVATDPARAVNRSEAGRLLAVTVAQVDGFVAHGLLPPEDAERGRGWRAGGALHDWAMGEPSVAVKQPKGETP